MLRSGNPLLLRRVIGICQGYVIVKHTLDFDVTLGNMLYFLYSLTVSFKNFTYSLPGSPLPEAILI